MLKDSGLAHVKYKKQLELYSKIKYYMKCNLECCTRNNNGMCDFCGDKETVYHFLIACPKYKPSRDIFLNCVNNSFMIYDIQLNLENILFPPKALSWHHRKMVLDSLCEYVRRTKRIYIRF